MAIGVGLGGARDGSAPIAHSGGMGDKIPGEDDLVGNTFVDLGDDAGDTGHIIFLADQAWSPVQGSKFCRGGAS